MKFFLGTHQPGWLSNVTVPLFVSDRRLRDYRTLPRAVSEWACDSGGFTELSTYGSWEHGPTPAQYAARVRRYRDEIGNLWAAAPQDMMCEPFILAKTGLTVDEHQRHTVDNLIELRTLAPDLPWMPVIQGWDGDSYLRCLDRYANAGIDLATEKVVALGSVCRRSATNQAARIIATITATVPGIRLHGLGIKTSGLRHYGSQLASSDSLAWSYAARREPPMPGCVGHKNCANCRRYALAWRSRVLAALDLHETNRQLSFYDVAT